MSDPAPMNRKPAPMNRKPPDTDDDPERDRKLVHSCMEHARDIGLQAYCKNQKLVKYPVDEDVGYIAADAIPLWLFALQNIFYKKETDGQFTSDEPNRNLDKLMDLMKKAKYDVCQCEIGRRR